MDIFAAAKGPKFKIHAPDFPARRAIRARQGEPATSSVTRTGRAVLAARAGPSECEVQPNPLAPRRYRWRERIIGGCLNDACDDGDIGAVYKLVRNSLLISSSSCFLEPFLSADPGEWLVAKMTQKSSCQTGQNSRNYFGRF